MNLPNKITFARILLIPVFIVAFFYGRYWEALVLFAILSGTDWLDGYLARKLNQITTLGKYLDPLADKLLIISALILLLPIERIFFSICLMIIFIRDFLVDGFCTIAIDKKVIIPANIWGKVKTCTQIASILLFLFGLAISNEYVLTSAAVILIIAVGLTIVSGVIYIAGKWKEVM
ncbi:CDP-diacylglycerol--glycerol-3-phosphate 3-phosphatidyltransferase [Treponema sp. R6D11]